MEVSRQNVDDLVVEHKARRGKYRIAQLELEEEAKRLSEESLLLKDALVHKVLEVDKIFKVIGSAPQMLHVRLVDGDEDYGFYMLQILGKKISVTRSKTSMKPFPSDLLALFEDRWHLIHAKLNEFSF